MKGWILDTNVVSELRKGEKMDPAVRNWQKSILDDDTFLSIITILEIKQGIHLVRPRDEPFAKILQDWLDQTLLLEFRESIIDVDMAIVEVCSQFPTKDTISQHDALIAATAGAYALRVASRNVSDIEPTGIPVINPWEFQS